MRIRYKNRFEKQRRDLLKTIAAAGISPALYKSCSLVGGMMIARATEAQAGPNKSLVLLMCGGSEYSKWKPSAGLKLGPTSAPFEKIKDEVVFMGGCSAADGQGGHGHMFKALGFNFGGDSFDVNMGRIIGANYPLMYFNLGVQSKAAGATAERAPKPHTPHNVVNPFNKPSEAISALKANAGGGGGGGGGGGTPAKDNRQLYVDVHKDSIDALRKKLGTHEQQKLDSHLTAIEALEKKLAASSGGNNSAPPPSSAGCNISTPNLKGDNSFEQDAFNQIEVALLALECNITASVSLMFGEDQQTMKVPTFPTGDVHQTHHAFPQPAYAKSSLYMNSLIARTIERTKAKGLLDKTVITSVCDMADGPSHGMVNAPIVVAGGGSAIRRGRVNEVGGKTAYDVFATVSKILGADASPDARKFGSAVTGIAS